jgi:DNA polymerase-3 subunit epsilon
MDAYGGTIERLAQLVEAHPDFRVLRRVKDFPHRSPPAGTRTRCGLLVDLETTSLDAARTQIIEAGLLLFSYTPEGEVVGVLDLYQGFSDPGVPIPEDAAAVNHITGAMVAGQSLDSARVAALIARADLLIAHQAQFDRMIMERFFPDCSAKPWGCSCSQVPWKGLGLGSASLDSLLNSFGFFHEGHRALEDCQALLHLLSQQCQGRTVLARLLDNVRRETLRLWAAEAPYEAKDLLHSRGYRWNPGDDGRLRAWNREILPEEEAAEFQWLAREVYHGEVQRVVRQRLTAYERFSLRG